MSELTKEDEFIKLANLAIQYNACAESVEEKDSLSDMPISEWITTKCNASWAMWVLKVLGNKIAEDARIEFINKIKDPMMAFHIYLSVTILTENEDILLRTKFEGKLPTAEKELQDEIVTRIKNG